MANSATVISLSGHAWIRNSDGSRTELHVGSKVPPGSEIITEANGQLQMAIDGSTGQPIVIGGGRDVAYAGEMSAAVQDVSQSQAQVPTGTDSDRLLQALNSGQDLLANLESAGAVGGGGGGGGAGGSSDAGFVVLSRLAVGTSPLGWGYPSSLPTVPELQANPAVEQPTTTVAPEVAPTVTLTAGSVPTEITSDALTAGGSQFTAGNNDSVTANFSSVFGVQTTAGSAAITSTTQTFSLSVGNANTGLTSHGVAVVLSQDANGNLVGTAGNNVVFTISINAQTGDVTLHQIGALDHGASGSATDVIESLAAGSVLIHETVTVTDANGNTGSQTAQADISHAFAFTDDAPTVTVTAALNNEITLHTSDANLPSGSAPEAAGADHATANFSSLFTSHFVMGADAGPGSSQSLAYSLSLTNGQTSMASGLSTEGSPITLNLVSGSIVGVDGNGHTAFTITVDSAGNVTLTQLEAIDHIAPADAMQTLATAGINLTATGTITDDDGDTASAHATANIGGSLAFADDAPTVTVALAGEQETPVLVTSDANLPSGSSPEAAGADHATGDFSALFTSHFVMGADNGAGSSQSLVYTLSLTNGQSTMAAGLSTEGSPITLNLVSGSIVGVDGNGHTAFTVTVDSTGHVTLTQFEAIDHVAPGDALQTLSGAGINLTATGTITDDDGDTATAHATANIGGSLAFADDAPTVSVDLSETSVKQLVTSDANLPSGSSPEAAGADHVTGDFSTLFTSHFVMGADNGTGSSQSLAYSLSLNNGQTSVSSGLSTEGSPITLNLVSGAIVGIDGNGHTAFTVTVDSTGHVTLTQFEAIDHVAPGDALQTLANAGINLTATGTIVDSDGDTATASATANIGGSLAFADDAPTVTVGLSETTVTQLVTSDANLPSGSSPEAAGADHVTGDFSTLFTSHFTMGADNGTGSSQSLVYTLSLNNGQTSAASGLSTEGSPITLNLVSGSIVGVDGNGHTAFTVTVDSTGHVTLTQFEAIDHVAPGDALQTLAGAGINLTATGTITDDDGDTATAHATANIGGSLAFADDAPTVTVGLSETTVTQLVTSDANLPSGSSPEAAGADHVTGDFSTLFTSHFVMGADNGTGSSQSLAYSLSLGNGQTSVSSGLSTEGSPITLNLVSGAIVGVDGNGHTAFTVTVDGTGHVTLTQFEAIDHVAPGDALQTLAGVTINLTATGTITDDDGDTATAHATANIGGSLAFADDAPTVTVALSTTTVTQLVTSDAHLPSGSSPEAAGADHVTGDFSTLFTSHFVMGADNGTGSSQSLVYTLSLNNGQTSAASGLSTEGSPITLNLVSGSIVGVDGNGHTAFTVTVDSTGHVTLTQFETIDHIAPADALQTLAGAGINLTATGTITDDDGDTATAHATANIGGSLAFADDAPTVTVALSTTTVTQLVTSDAHLPSGSSPEAAGADHVTGDFSTLFTSHFVMGADNGTGSSQSLVYSLSLNNGQTSAASGLSTEGSAITLNLVSGAIVGVDSHGNTAFTVTVDSTGHVTLTQFEAIDHVAPGDALQTLAGAGINLTATGTITDDDGDTSTAHATANIGGSLAFADDAPTVTVALSTTTVTQLVTSDAHLPSGSSPEAAGADHVTGDFSTLFTSHFVMGADNGTGSSQSLAYSLSLSNGQTSVSSGLSTEGSPITLKLVSGSIVGVDSHGNTAFTVTVDSTGHVTLTQFEAIDHVAPGDALQTLAGVTINLTATGTIIDDDGDHATASATANIGGSLAFADDAPSVSVALSTTTVTQLVTSDANLPSGSSPQAAGADHVTGDFSTLFTSHFVMGADNGTGSSQSLAYSLSLSNGQTSVSSGLSTEGSPITLKLVSGSIVGVDGNGHTAFTVTVDSTGHVTLTQFEAIDHVAPGDALQTLAGVTINLTATGTIIDDDGDHATASATANIGGSLAFADDAPTVTVALSGTTVTQLVTSDANLPSGTSPEAAGADHVTGDFSALFSSHFVMGADNGAGSSQGLTYALSLSNGQTSVSSGLSTEGSPITLKLVSGSIVGVDGNGHTAFTVTVDSTGHVTLTQFEAIDHIAPSDALQTLAGVTINLTATGTIIDDDGDHATSSATANIGGSLAFADDAPHIDGSAAAVTLTTNGASSVTGNLDVHVGADNGTGAHVTIVGTEGAPVMGTTDDNVSVQLSSGGNQLVYHLVGNTLEAGYWSGTTFNEVFAVNGTINSDGTTSYTVTQTGLPIDPMVETSITTTTFDWSTATTGGNNSSGILDVTDPTSHYTMEFKSTGGSINFSGGGIGVSNNWIDSGETMSVSVLNASNQSLLTDNLTMTLAGKSGSATVDWAAYNGTTLVAHGTIAVGTGTELVVNTGSALFDHVVLSGDTSHDSFRILASGDMSVSTQNTTTHDVTVTTSATVTDSDGDTSAAQSVSIDLHSASATPATDHSMDVYAGNSDSVLVGGSANDVLHGGTGNDSLYGGAGNDTLYGGGGANTFVWKLGDQGTTAAPAVDKVMDFNVGTAGVNHTTNGDVLDLSSLLQGHADSSHLHIGLNSAGQVQIDINTSGALNTTTGANANQEIVITNLTNLTGLGSGSSDQIINQMIHDGKMKVS